MCLELENENLDFVVSIFCILFQAKHSAFAEIVRSLDLLLKYDPWCCVDKISI